MPEENLYDLLQEESTADSRAIRATYRRLMLLHHLDRNLGPDVQKMTQRLNLAARSSATRTEGEPAIMNFLVGLRGWPLIQFQRELDQHLARGRSWWCQGRPAWHASGFIDCYNREHCCDCDEFRGADRRSPNRAGSRAETNLDYHSTVHSQSDTTNNGSPTTVPIPNVTAVPTAVFMESGDFGWAVDALTSELNLIPSYVCCHQIRGFSYYQTGQYRLTIADFNQVRGMHSLSAAGDSRVTNFRTLTKPGSTLKLPVLGTTNSVHQ